MPGWRSRRCCAPSSAPATPRRRCGARGRAVREAVRAPSGGRRSPCTSGCWRWSQAALPDAVIVGDQTQPVYAGNQFYRAGAAALLVQLEHRLRHAGLCAAGRDRRQARGAGPAGGGADRRRRPAVHPARAGLRGRGARCRSIVLLWNNQGYGEIKTYMAEKGIPADRRRHLHARFRRDRQRLRLRRPSAPRASSICASSCWRRRGRDRADA